jgi:glycosyltransferase involved in cell wall biosynthesis
LLSYFGFLNESKGCLYLVEAVAALVSQGVKVTLVMIGGKTGASDRTNSSYGARVDASIMAHGITNHVVSTGFISDNEVSDYFLASDICVLPYMDGASLRRGTLMAALQHGRAIVTSTPESLSPELEGIAEFVPVGDSDAIAKQVLNLWRNPARRKQLERAASLRSREFAWDSIAERTVTFYKDVLNEQ